MMACRWALLFLAVFAPVAIADDQAAMLQAALIACRAQTANANAWAQEQIAAMTLQNGALQKRVAELEEAAKKAAK